MLTDRPKPSKSVGLIKIGINRGVDFKSKILTTNECTSKC